jgi:hypothetical protein
LRFAQADWPEVAERRARPEDDTDQGRQFTNMIAVEE